MEEAQICWRSVRRRGTEVADDNRNIAVASMSPLVSEDGVRVPDAVQHDAPHALCNPLGGYRRVVVLR